MKNIDRMKSLEKFRKTKNNSSKNRVEKGKRLNQAKQIRKTFEI